MNRLYTYLSKKKYHSILTILVCLTSLCSASSDADRIFEPTYFPISPFYSEERSPSDGLVKIPISRDLLIKHLEQGEVAVEFIADGIPDPVIVPIGYKYENEKDSVWWVIAELPDYTNITMVVVTNINTNKIFEPTYFPISSFQRPVEIPEGNLEGSVAISVKREVLTFFLERGEVAVEFIADNKPIPTVAFIKDYRYEDSGDNVWLIVELPEHSNVTMVVVTNVAQHRFPIVTHWKQSDPNDRGGFFLGGTDSLKTFDKDGNIITNDYEVDPRTLKIAKGSDAHINPSKEPGEPTYNKALALFEDPDADTVSYELYIGENYSIFKPSELTALLLAHQVMEETGFPVLFLNSDDDPYENVPAFQVINSHIVKHPESSSSALATFFLPPYWNDDIADRYSIAVNGQYDLHERVYRVDHGFGIMKMLNDAGKESIGIIWNNGGSLGPIANHLTYFHNAHQMFKDAKDLFAADWTRIIAFGGSRGGAQALALAANPYYHADSYRVKTAICVSPPCYIGDLLADVSISSHPALASVSDLYAGYFQSWVSYWEHPDTGRSSEESMAFTLTGQFTREGANSMSAGDLDFINSLKDKGTEVVVSYGTNDSFFPTYMAVDYIKALRDAGVEVKHELAYRNGHGGPGGSRSMFEQATDALLAIDNSNGYLEESDLKFFPYKPIFNDKSEFTGKHKRLQDYNDSNDPIPFVCELPAVSYSGQPIQMGFYGSAGTRFKLKLVVIDSEKWDVGKEIVEIKSSEITVLDQTLPDLESQGYDLSYLLFDGTMPTVYEMVEGIEPMIFRIPRYWLYKLEIWDAKLKEFKPVGINQTAYALNDNSQDSRLFSEAVLEVFASEADLAGEIGLGINFSDRYGPGSRGMGLSNDQQF